MSFSTFGLLAATALLGNSQPIRVNTEIEARLNCQSGLTFTDISQTWKINFNLNVEGSFGIHSSPQHKCDDSMVKNQRNFGSLTEWITTKDDGFEHFLEIQSGNSQGPYVLPFKVEASNKVKKVQLVDDAMVFKMVDETSFSYDKFVVYDATGKELKSKMQLSYSNSTHILSLHVLESGKFPILIDPFFAKDYPRGEPTPLQTIDAPNNIAANPWKGMSEVNWDYQYGDLFGHKVGLAKLSNTDRCDLVVGSPRTQVEYDTDFDRNLAFEFEVDYRGRLEVFENTVNDVSTTPFVVTDQEITDDKEPETPYKCNSAHFGYNFKISNLQRDDGYDTLMSGSHTCKFFIDVIGGPSYKTEGVNFFVPTFTEGGKSTRPWNYEMLHDRVVYFANKRPAESAKVYFMMRENADFDNQPRFFNDVDDLFHHTNRTLRVTQKETRYKLGFSSATHKKMINETFWIGDYSHTVDRMGAIHLVTYFDHDDRINHIKWRMKKVEAGNTFVGTQFDAKFGKTLVMLDRGVDSNVPTLIVGEPGWSSDKLSDVGRVHIYLGDENLSNATSQQWMAPHTIEGEKALSQFSFSLANVGDITFDGMDDFAVGAPYEDNGTGQSLTGAIYIFESTASAPYYKFHQYIKGTETQGLFGYSISAGCNVNNDNFKDIAIGIPGANSEVGQVMILNSREYSDIDLTLSSPSLSYGVGDAFTVSSNFTNKGPTDFSGTYTLVYKLSVQGIYPIIVPTLLSTGGTCAEYDIVTQSIVCEVNALAEGEMFALDMNFQSSITIRQASRISFLVQNEIMDTVVNSKTMSLDVDIINQVSLYLAPRPTWTGGLTEIGSAAARLHAFPTSQIVNDPMACVNHPDGCAFENSMSDEFIYLQGPNIISEDGDYGTAFDVRLVISHPVGAKFLGIIAAADYASPSPSLTSPPNFFCSAGYGKTECTVSSMPVNTNVAFDNYLLRFSSAQITSAAFNFIFTLQTSTTNTNDIIERSSNPLFLESVEYNLNLAIKEVTNVIDATSIASCGTPCDGKYIAGSRANMYFSLQNVGDYGTAETTITVTLSTGFVSPQVQLTKYRGSIANKITCYNDAGRSDAANNVFVCNLPLGGLDLADYAEVFVDTLIEDVAVPQASLAYSAVVSADLTPTGTVTISGSVQPHPFSDVLLRFQALPQKNMAQDKYYPALTTGDADAIVRQVSVLNQGPSIVFDDLSTTADDFVVTIELDTHETFHQGDGCTASGKTVTCTVIGGLRYNQNAYFKVETHTDGNQLIAQSIDTQTATASISATYGGAIMDSLITYFLGADLGMFWKSGLIQLVVGKTNKTAVFGISNAAPTVTIPETKFSVRFSDSIEIASYSSTGDLDVSCTFTNDVDQAVDGFLNGECTVLNQPPQTEYSLGFDLVARTDQFNDGEDGTISMAIVSPVFPQDTQPSVSRVKAIERPVEIDITVDAVTTINVVGPATAFVPEATFRVEGSIFNLGYRSTRKATHTFSWNNSLVTMDPLLLNMPFCESLKVNPNNVSCVVPELLGLFNITDALQFDALFHVNAGAQVTETFQFMVDMPHPNVLDVNATVADIDTDDTNNEKVLSLEMSVLEPEVDLKLQTTQDIAIINMAKTGDTITVPMGLIITNSGLSVSHNATVTCTNANSDFFSAVEYSKICTVSDNNMICKIPTLYPSSTTYKMDWNATVTNLPVRERLNINCKIVDDVIANDANTRDNEANIPLRFSEKQALISDGNPEEFDYIIIIIFVAVSVYIIINLSIMGFYSGMFKRKAKPDWDMLDAPVNELDLHE